MDHDGREPLSERVESRDKIAVVMPTAGEVGAPWACPLSKT